MRTSLSAIAVLALSLLAPACSDGDDDDDGPVIDAGDGIDAADDDSDAAPGDLPATTACEAPGGQTLCDSSIEICVKIDGTGTCELLPGDCDGPSDADRTCASCGSACGDGGCADDADVNTITCL